MSSLTTPAELESSRLESGGGTDVGVMAVGGAACRAGEETDDLLMDAGRTVTDCAGPGGVPFVVACGPAASKRGAAADSEALVLKLESSAKGALGADAGVLNWGAAGFNARGTVGVVGLVGVVPLSLIEALEVVLAEPFVFVSSNETTCCRTLSKDEKVTASNGRLNFSGNGLTREVFCLVYTSSAKVERIS